jgi:hypothetical protein
MKKRILLLTCFILLFVISLVGCGNKNETPPLTEDILKEICSNAIKQDMYFDQISNMTFEYIETSEKDMNSLKEVFASAVPYQSIKCTANISSIAMDAYVEYNLVCAYNMEWKVISCYSVNEGNWEYDAKKFVSLKEIMNDLKNIKVGLFEQGYCGDEKNSTLTINNREEDKSINRETVYCTLKIDTDFGYYEVDIEAIYYFKKGKWVIGDFVIPEVHKWKFTFDENYEIKLFNDEYIEKKLTTKTEFLTYIVNLDNISSSAIYLEGMKADTEFVTYNYVYTVSYDGIGLVTYNIDISYEWLFLEWGEGQFKISVKNNDFKELNHTKYVFGDKYLTIKDIVNYDEDLVPEDTKINEASQFVTIEYFDGQDKYELFCNLLVVLRDNNYDLNILKITKDGKEVKRFTDFEKIVLDITDKSLTAGNKFKNDPSFVYVEEVIEEDIVSEYTSFETTVIDSSIDSKETISIKKESDESYYILNKKEKISNNEVISEEKTLITKEEYDSIINIINGFDWTGYKDYTDIQENSTNTEIKNIVKLINVNGDIIKAQWAETSPQTWKENNNKISEKITEIINNYSTEN